MPKSVWGFTLIEVIVTLTLMSVLFSFGLILSMDVYRATLERSSRDVLVTALTTARTRALVNLHQSPHGVCYRAPDFIVFRGTLYDAASPFNETMPGDPSITLTSANDFLTCGTGSGIVFGQLSATTSNTEVVTIAEEGRPSQSVQVNALGTIVW